MDLGLKDRVYVVTGATRGLGLASARELTADGAKVVLTGRDGKRAADAAASLGPNAVGVAADNSDPAAAGQLIAAAREHFGRFDGILVSVGGPAPAPPRTTPTSSGRPPSNRSSWARSASPARPPPSWARAGSSASSCRARSTSRSPA